MSLQRAKFALMKHTRKYGVLQSSFWIKVECLSWPWLFSAGVWRQVPRIMHYVSRSQQLLWSQTSVVWHYTSRTACWYLMCMDVVIETTLNGIWVVKLWVKSIHLQLEEEVFQLPCPSPCNHYQKDCVSTHSRWVEILCCSWKWCCLWTLHYSQQSMWFLVQFQCYYKYYCISSYEKTVERSIDITRSIWAARRAAKERPTAIELFIVCVSRSP